MKTKLSLVFIALLITAPTSYAATSDSSESSLARLGHHSFAIPDKYLLESSFMDRLVGVLGLDDGSRDWLLHFDGQDLAEAVPGYQARGKYRDDIVALLAVLTDVERARASGGDRYSDLWHGQGLYKDRIIEAFPDRPWFKVFRSKESPESWAVVSRYPEASLPVPAEASDFWIAHCLRLKGATTPSGHPVSCKTYVLFSDLMIELSVSEQNLPVLGRLKEYLKSKVLEWQRD